MPSLECSVKNCYYNDNNCCCKRAIIVEGQEATEKNMTCCGSFDKQKEGVQNSCCEPPQHHLTVECDAVNCRYNEQHKCHADKIDISGQGSTQSAEGTNCATFEMR
ncbi:MAG: DUF1540 domain-containing protein [Lachnospiraceae bacterium]